MLWDKTCGTLKKVNYHTSLCKRLQIKPVSQQRRALKGAKNCDANVQKVSIPSPSPRHLYYRISVGFIIVLDPHYHNSHVIIYHFHMVFQSACAKVVRVCRVFSVPNKHFALSLNKPLKQHVELKIHECLDYLQHRTGHTNQIVSSKAKRVNIHSSMVS